MMKTLYDVLGVPRNASEERIRAAFRKAAKLYHPDLNAGDSRAEQQLRQAIAAYEMLRNPQKRMTYDRYLRDCRRESMRGFAMTAAAGLVSGSLVVALVVTLFRTQDASVPPPAPRAVAAKVNPPASQPITAGDSSGRQETDRGRKSDRGTTTPNRHLADDRSRNLQQTVSSVQPTAGHPAPRGLAREGAQGGHGRQLQASSDPVELRAFAARNPDAPESEQARSKLMALIDTAEDVSLLNILRLGGSGVIADRAQQRLARLGAQAKEDRTGSRPPSANSLEGRAVSFIAARIAGWSSSNAAANSNLAAHASAYADRVLYYGKPKSRHAVLTDKRRLLEQWPERTYQVQPGSITARCVANVCRVSGTMVWQTRSVARAESESGIAQFEYEVTFSRGAFSIVSEGSAAPKRYAQDDRRSQSPPRVKETAPQQRASR